MTLIVGILCEDGVAIAADRQATAVAFLPLNNPPTVVTSVHAVTKVASIGDDTLLAVSGHPPIGDEYEAAIVPRRGNFKNTPYMSATETLRGNIKKIIDGRLQTAALVSSITHPLRLLDESTCECLLAANFKDGHRLICITRTGLFEVATKELPLKIIGSGQLHADPFLLFLKNTFWPSRLPTVNEGMLAACWAVEWELSG